MDSLTSESEGKNHPPGSVSVGMLRRRLQGIERRRLQGDSRAAVAAIFKKRADRQSELLFIHRAEDQRDPWSGHMAFPGGRVDRGDPTPRAAAIRETLEEVGLDLDRHGREIGRLSDVTAVAQGRRLGLVIEPFVFELLDEVPLRTNWEVQDVVWIPLGFFLDRRNRSNLSYRFEDRLYDLPCYRWHERVVWGLTLRILDELIECAGGGPFSDWPDRGLR